MKQSIICECGNAKAQGDDLGCPRCKAIQSARASIAAKRSGTRQRSERFGDVRAACDRWLKARGIESGESDW